MPELPITIQGLRKALLAGELDIGAVVQEQYRRAKALDAEYHCVTRFHQQAKPHEAGCLAGVGLAHKDIFQNGGEAPHCGRPEPVASLPASATVLERLAAAGAVNLAALAMSEFACSATAMNPWLPQPVNPLDAAAAVGGSSGGSAIAVAAGLAYASLGTDTGGSVRIPAATCGLIGIKPTAGAVSNVGVFPLAPSLDTVGVLARSAWDAAMIFLTIADSMDDSRLQPRRPEDWFRASPQDGQWRIRHLFDSAQLHGPTRTAVGAFLHDCGAFGSVRRAPPAELKELSRLARVILHVEAARVHAPTLQETAPSLDASTRAVILPGLGIPASWYESACNQRGRRLSAFVDTYFSDADLLLMPALPRGVPDWSQVIPGGAGFDRQVFGDLYAWMGWINYLGLPSIVMPVGVDVRGRPLCVQAVGRPDAEALLLSFADRYAAGKGRDDVTALSAVQKSIYEG